MDTNNIAPEVVGFQPMQPITLNERWLWIGRLAWLVFTLLVLLVLSQLWPGNYWATYGEWLVRETYPVFHSATAYRNFVRLVTLIESLSALTALGVSFLIFWHRSGDKMGLFVSATLVLVSPWFLNNNMEVWQLPVWMPFAPTILTFLQAATLSSLVLFFFLFPNGHFYPRWTRWFAVLALFLFSLFVFSTLFNIPSLFDGLWFIYAGVFFLCLLIAGFAQLHRYRTQTDPVQRQQIKWVVFAIALYTFTTIPAGFGLLGGSSSWGRVIELLFTLLASWFISLAVGFSILRYRLWDIDLIINRTAVYGGLTALVIGLYILLVGGLSQWLELSNDPLLAALATGLIAILFEPLRRRLQGRVNQLMYGEQDDPLTLLGKLGSRLQEAAISEATLLNFVETVAKSLKLPYVAIIQQNQPMVWYGNSTTETVSFLLVHQGEIVGQLVIGKRGAGESFTKQELRLLEYVTRQAGAAVYAVRLTTDLQHSRERLVTTREEERRRIHRDLHDDLGPQLASLTLKADAARNLLQHSPQQAEQLLIELKGQSQMAVSTIRQLVYDLRPPAVDQLGLLSALREYTAGHQNNGLTVTIEAPDPFPALPAAVEVALYRIATEALTNVWHHAQARTCTVALYPTAQEICLEISDDGVGLPEKYPAGVGLLSMRERATELGGHCTIARRPEGGTRLIATLPIQAATPNPSSR